MCGTFSNNDTVEYLLQKAFEGDLTFCKYRPDNSANYKIILFMNYMYSIISLRAIHINNHICLLTSKFLLL